jgi:ankyrin repeat protein
MVNIINCLTNLMDFFCTVLAKYGINDTDDVLTTTKEMYRTHLGFSVLLESKINDCIKSHQNEILYQVFKYDFIVIRETHIKTTIIYDNVDLFNFFLQNHNELKLSMNSIFALVVESNKMNFFHLICNFDVDLDYCDYIILNKAINNKSPMVKYLLDMGCKVTWRHIYWAIRTDIEMLKLLLQHMPSIINSDILSNACENGTIEMVQLCLDLNIPVNSHNYLILGRAVKRGNIEIVRLLLQHGADIALDHEYPVYFAVYCNHMEILKLLLDVGTPSDVDMDRALEHAIEKNKISMIELLLQNGVKITNVSFYNACQYCNLSTVMMLQDYRIDKNVNFWCGMYTPLLICCERGEFKMVQYLLGQGAFIEPIFENLKRYRLKDKFINLFREYGFDLESD